MKILILPFILMSISASASYSQKKLNTELSSLKKNLYSIPELVDIMETEDNKEIQVSKNSETKVKPNQKSKVVTKSLTLEKLQDLEEIYFDKVSTKKSGLQKRVKPIRQRQR